MSPANRNYHNRTIDILNDFSPPAILALMITKSSTAVQVKIKTKSHNLGTASVQAHTGLSVQHLFFWKLPKHTGGSRPVHTI